MTEIIASKPKALVAGATIGQNIYAQDDTFWETYITGRPKIPQSFFDFIFDYHSRQGGEFGTVHEVGAGVGVHSPKLAARFRDVLVSDVIEKNVNIARQRLTGSYSFKVTSLEDTVDLPAASMDLVFASTMMHFCENDAAVKAIHHQLKSGGTFAAGLYGTFALHEPEAQKVWCKIVCLICEMIVECFGLDDRAKMILQNEASGLDSVGLPEEWFSPALRFDYNFPTKDTLREMILPSQCGISTVSRIGAHDSVARDWDRGWFEKNDINGLRKIAATWPHDAERPDLVSLWNELQDVIGDGTVDGAWMVSLLLATKK